MWNVSKVPSEDANLKYNFAVSVFSSGHVSAQYETCSDEFDHNAGYFVNDSVINLNQPCRVGIAHQPPGINRKKTNLKTTGNQYGNDTKYKST